MNTATHTTARVTPIRRARKRPSHSLVDQCKTSLQPAEITAVDLARQLTPREEVAILAHRTSDASVTVLDLRAATSADDRENKVIVLLDELYAALYANRIVEMTWPTDADATAATSYLGAPLASIIHRCVEHTRGHLVIHTRAGTGADFETLPFNTRVTFVMHLNGEEAAMRWERTESSPARRLVAAATLRNAGWRVQLCIGITQFFPGWRDDYTDLVERCTAANFTQLLVRFAGDPFGRVSAPLPSAKQREEFLMLIQRTRFAATLETAA